MTAFTLTNRPEANRYEARVDGELAGLIDYRLDGSVVEFPHTEVDPRFGGRGIGSALVRAALDAASVAQHTVIPTCPFVLDWIERHPTYQGLVAE